VLDHRLAVPLKNLQDGLGRRLVLFLGAYLIVVMVLGWWVPSNDFDSMATYLPAVRIADTDGLNAHTATQAQRFGPLFFIRLEERLLATGYLSSSINFVLFLVCGYLIAAGYRKDIASWAVLLLFSVQPIAAALTSLKNDLTVGTLAMIVTLTVFRMRPSIWYAGACFGGIALLIGTKWHGVIVALPILLALLYRLSTSHRPKTASILLLIGSIPLFGIFSSADRYWENYQQTGSFFPHMDAVQYLGHGPRPILANVWRLVSCTAIDTFSLPLYFLNVATDGGTWSFVHWLTLGGQDLNFVIGPNSTHSVFGFPLLLVLIADIWAIRAAGLALEVRALGITSLFYCVIVTSMSQYIGFAPRYYIASYITGVIPLAHLLASLRPSAAALLKVTLLAYMFVELTQTLVLDPERPLVGYPVSVRTGTASVDYYQASIWRNIFKREELYFQIWPGYLPAYRYFAENVLRSDSVLFLNCGRNQDVPFIYPFLRLREQANTAFYRCDDQGSERTFVQQHPFAFVVAYKYRVEDPRYSAVLVQNGFFDIAIYRNADGRPAAIR
jgi:hypothetical protein